MVLKLPPPSAIPLQHSDVTTPPALWVFPCVLGSLCTDLHPSPEMTSRSNMSLRPLRKSSSMFSIWVPALRRCELHQAVKVWGQRTVLRP